jgi:tetratricopeptide (TPR) repeat protein
VSQSDVATCSGALASLTFMLASWWAAVPASAQDTCTPPVARIVSIQGSVEIQRAGQPQWVHVTRLDTPLCAGDRVQTGVRSRAALVISPETLVRLDQSSALSIRVTQNETVVEFFQDPTAPREALGTACGAGYFITRFPRRFEVRTPFLNAAVEGTEFLVALTCQATTLAVLEGRVSAQAPGSSPQEKRVLQSGQSTTVERSGEAVTRVLLKPADAVQWTLYYPPTESGDGVEPGERCEAGAALVQCLVARAQRLLRVGRVDEAQVDIEAALTQDPSNGAALALRAIVSLTKNEVVQAFEQARLATDAAPTSARAWTALSYTQQAQFALEDALVSARRAASLSPASALMRARVAELLLSLGRSAKARREALQAVALDENTARAHLVLGFAYLGDANAPAAQREFERAVELDQAEPLARLGLGVAIIRQGNLTAGREQIEIAAVLDPINALVRSYLGKAYFEEDTGPRDALAASQFAMAKSLDRRDPTPWLYGATLKQTQNRSVEALWDSQESIALNDNRGVFRSRLLLDQDLAARSENLAQVYRDLGFQQLSLVEGWRSLEADPTNFSAHRLMSDAYASLPRHEIARVSELLQSEMLAPLTLNPIEPGTAQSDLTSRRVPTIPNPSFMEYTSLFVRDQLGLRVNAVGGSNDTYGENLLLSGLFGRYSFGIGQFHYETDGYRENNDYQDTAYNAFVQTLVTPQTSLLAELGRRELEHGDITQRVPVPQADPTYRRALDQDLARVGFRHSPSPSATILGVATYTERTETTHKETTGTFFGVPIQTIDDTQREDRALTGELQLLTKTNRLSTIIGGGYSDTDGELTERSETVSAMFPFLNNTTVTPSDVSVQQSVVYGYATAKPVESLAITLGLSADEYNGVTFERSQTNPKFGVTWQALPSTALRFAAFRTLKRVLVADQTLEPVQIAGFNQFYDDENGTDAKEVAVGVDQRFTNRLFGGLAWAKRDLDVPKQGGTLDETQEEDLARAYLAWTPAAKVSLSAEAFWETLSIDPVDFDPSRPIDLRTLRAPFAVRFAPSSRVALTAGATYVWQQVGTQAVSAGPLVETSADFWTVDLAATYFLPRRYGALTLEVRNLFDQDFQYQDPNFRSSVPRLPEFVPERTVFLRLNLVF